MFNKDEYIRELLSKVKNFLTTIDLEHLSSPLLLRILIKPNSTLIDENNSFDNMEFCKDTYENDSDIYDDLFSDDDKSFIEKLDRNFNNGN